MNFTLTKQCRAFQPLYCDESEIILLRRGSIYRSDLDLNRPEFVCSLPPERPFVERTHSRFLARVFRLAAQAAIRINDDLFIARRTRLWKVNLQTGEASLDFEVPDRRRILNLSRVVDDDRQEWLCFGEYFMNPEKKPVHIWRRSLRQEGRWQISFQFEAGQIDHVHNIVQTSAGRVYVLTGDFGEGSAIWSASKALDRLTPVARGDQKFRACWLAEGERGDLYYATDSQFVENSVRRLQWKQDSASTTAIKSIEGSSIYSGAYGENVVFSSAVEPGESSGYFLLDMLERRRGPGIRSDDAVIYSMDAEGRVCEQFRARKDFYPSRLAQFGTFLFPSGKMPATRFYAYAVALRGYDDCCLCFEGTDSNHA